MRRLYLQLYVTVVASLIVFALAAGYLWRVLVHVAPPPQAAELAGEIAQGALPAPDAPREAQQAALDRLSAGGRVQLGIRIPGSFISSFPPPSDPRGHPRPLPRKLSASCAT